MNKLIAFFKLIRVPNLLMLVLAQFVVSYIFEYSINNFILFLVSFSTVFIAASGYIINDIEDVQIDKFNKANYNQFFTKNVFTIFYLFSSFLGLSSAFYVSYLIELSNFFYFFFAFVSLFFYAKFFSKYKLIGNIIISILVALSIFIILIFVNKTYLTKLNDSILWLILLYGLLAFAMNWIREIIKDIEDIEGDSLAKRKTMPMVFGIEKTKYFVLFLLSIVSFLIVMQIIYWHYFLLIPAFFLNIFIAFKILKANTKKDYKNISKAIKISMLLGILYPLSF